MADQLNRMFGQGKTPASQYVASAYHDWSTDPFVRGGYMCVLPKAKRDVLFSFDHPTLYFAGESYGSAFSSVGGKLLSNFYHSFLKFILLFFSCFGIWCKGS